jgi:hypothetical protein
MDSIGREKGACSGKGPAQGPGAEKGFGLVLDETRFHSLIRVFVQVYLARYTPVGDKKFLRKVQD